ncbi:Acyl carrier protein 1, mitochondrial [Geranomyces michiganensis]|nr:Acyl carrier protein 1, mitochondrial [Geranomyces michiganensis]
MSNTFRFAASAAVRMAPTRAAFAGVAAPIRRVPIAAVPTFATRFYSAEKAPLTPQQVEDRILQLLRDFDKVEASKLNLDSHFINDLGLDSLDQVEITMALEDEFNIEIPDRDAEEIMTPRQAADKIFSNKNAM